MVMGRIHAIANSKILQLLSFYYFILIIDLLKSILLTIRDD